MNILSRSPEETFGLGEKIGKRLTEGMIIALEGDLGGGKTTFTKGLAKGLGIKEEITSPSFTLEKVYDLPAVGSRQTADKKILRAADRKPLTYLYHFDFYRIENPMDMISYELMEALGDLNGIVVIEWAEKIEAELPKAKLVVKFHYKDVETRLLEFIPIGFNYKQLIKNLKLKSQKSKPQRKTQK